MGGENDLSTQDPIGNVTDEDGLMELFDQFSGLMSPVSLTRIIYYYWHQDSLQGKSTTYQVTIQNVITTALLDTEANISVVSEKNIQIITSNT